MSPWSTSHTGLMGQVLQPSCGCPPVLECIAGTGHSQCGPTWFPDLQPEALTNATDTVTDQLQHQILGGQQRLTGATIEDWKDPG